MFTIPLVPSSNTQEFAPSRLDQGMFLTPKFLILFRNPKIYFQNTTPLIGTSDGFVFLTSISGFLDVKNFRPFMKDMGIEMNEDLAQLTLDTLISLRDKRQGGADKVPIEELRKWFR